MSVSEQKRKEDKEKAERLLGRAANVSDMLQITVKRYGSTREMKHNSEYTLFVSILIRSESYQILNLVFSEWNFIPAFSAGVL